MAEIPKTGTSRPGEGAIPTRSLKDAIAIVKNREADNTDVVVEMKEAEQARLGLLANEIRPLLDQIDVTDQRFDFGITRGERPRLWIDATSFVCMAQDKRNYRFLKDTRMGRVVMSQSADINVTADAVSDYVAERVLERERMIEGDWLPIRGTVAPSAQEMPLMSHTPTTSAQAQALVTAPARPNKWRGFAWFLFGIFCAIAVLFVSALILTPEAF